VKDLNITLEQVMSQAELSYLYPSMLRSDLRWDFEPIAAFCGLMVGNEETFNINGQRDDDEYDFSFNPCRSRKLVDLSGCKALGKIPSWEQSLVHEEPIANGEDFPPPFDDSICQVSVLAEDSYHYLGGMGDYFRRI
jgi:hypothetical protein